MLENGRIAFEIFSNFGKNQNKALWKIFSE